MRVRCVLGLQRAGEVCLRAAACGGGLFGGCSVWGRCVWGAVACGVCL